jgi:hypothetical protein
MQKQDYEYKVSNEVLVKKDCILRKAESPNSKMPWTITKKLKMEQSGFNAEQNWNESISRD